MLSRQIEATDGAIDKLVYELYGLMKEEIAAMEGSDEPWAHSISTGNQNGKTRHSL